MILDFWGETDESNNVLSYFGGWDGLSNINSRLKLLKRGDLNLSLPLRDFLVFLHIQELNILDLTVLIVDCE
jgi:hypothetical protein